MAQDMTNSGVRPIAGWLKRWIRYPLEAFLLWLLFALSRALPTDAASNAGGWLGRALGPRLRGHQRARVNLSIAMPTLTEAEVEAVLGDMWDNLGRTLAEYPHLQRIATPDSGRVSVEGLEHVEPFLRGERAGILLASHLANWEIQGVYSNKVGLPLTTIARPINNPLVDRIIERCRGDHGHARIAKNVDSAKRLLAALREGGVIGILADQKFNRGIEIPFFGRPARTTDAPAQLALRTGCLVVPVQVKREGPGRFTMVCHPPIEPHKGGSNRPDVAKAMMGAYHRLLESWIADRPAEWLWIHRRWPKELYR